MASKAAVSGHGKGKQKKVNSKPPLTHFLCFPLVNSISIPQLESSLAEFKASIPFIQPPASGFGAASATLPLVPLLPEGAHRPLGTLHLTLGVMSLPTEERLQEATSFFQSLDLESMLRNAESQTILPIQPPKATEFTESSPSTMKPPELLRISLTSLHALPNAFSATVLHAHPVDTTSRLYPFSVDIRNRFIAAGFMECEMLKSSKDENSHDVGDDAKQNNPKAEELKGAKSPTGLKRPRPLLLHATIANTIYLGRQGLRVGEKKKIYKFDATELLARFGGGDSSPNDGSNQRRQRNTRRRHGKENGKDREASAKIEGQDLLKPQVKSTFIWACDVPLDRLCICEMGAKRVPHDESLGGPILGEAYRVVAERSLDFTAWAGQDWKLFG